MFCPKNETRSCSTPVNPQTEVSKRLDSGCRCGSKARGFGLPSAKKFRRSNTNRPTAPSGEMKLGSVTSGSRDLMNQFENHFRNCVRKALSPMLFVVGGDPCGIGNLSVAAKRYGQ